MRPLSFLLAGLVTAACVGCTSGGGSTASGGSSGAVPTPAQTPPARWAEFRHLPGVVDVAGPRDDGSFVISAAGRLYLLRNGGTTLTPFARGPGGYQTSTGGEPYITMAKDVASGSSHCPFVVNEVFALEPSSGRPQVVEINPAGQARPFTSLPPGVGLDGIAFDTTGRFGHRLLVTGGRGGRTTVFAIDCAGTASTLTSDGPPVEGGIAVAPPAFGAFAGDLIAPNETSGRVYAIQPDGRTVTLAISGLPSGGDIGVESAGFVPPGFGAGAASAAYLADRYSGQANKHPGDDSLLRLSGAALTKAGIQPGDLLVAAEGGALTIDVRCATTCTVRYIADGPPIAHAEGHIGFSG
ncbi:MAG: hypothetical protein JO345_40085 [Streptosporangiaceae bacterium]|nr:hypothetical protein [Streptosporangiaceae bacterium]